MNSVPVSSGQQLIPPGSSSHKPPRSCLPQNPVDPGWGGAVLSLPWGIPQMPGLCSALLGLDQLQWVLVHMPALGLCWGAIQPPGGERASSVRARGVFPNVGPRPASGIF